MSEGSGIGADAVVLWGRRVALRSLRTRLGIVANCGHWIGGVARGRGPGLRIHLDRAIVHGEHAGSPAGVMLPEQDGLVIYEFAAVRVDGFAPKVFVLQKVQEIQAHGVFEIACIFRFLPVQQVFQIVHKGCIFKIPTLSED